MTKQEVLGKLKKLGSKENIAGMARFGIRSKKAFGVSKKELDKIAKEIGTDHPLAKSLWASDYHEARMLAALIADPEKADTNLAERWVKDFDNWAVEDNAFMHLFWKLPWAYKKIIEWSKREPEFEKRAGFALMAVWSWKNKEAQKKELKKFFPLIIAGARDERDSVKKAVSWALRQIGKRDLFWNREAIVVAEKILKKNEAGRSQLEKNACWVARDVLRELKSKKIQKRLAKK